MRRNWIVIVTAASTVLASVLLVLTFGGQRANDVWSQGQDVRSESYSPLPTRALAAGDIGFAPLSNAQSPSVRISPLDAVHEAEPLLHLSPTSPNVSVSLGGFINKVRIVRDWSGTKSWIPKVTPAYIVTVSGLHIVASLCCTVNHQEYFVVSARTGRVIEAFSYR